MSSVNCQYSPKRKVCIIVLAACLLLSTVFYAVSWDYDRATASDVTNNLYYAALALQLVGLISVFITLVFFSPTAFVKVGSVRPSNQ